MTERVGPRDSIDEDFEELNRRLAERDLAELRARWRRRVLVTVGSMALVGLVVLGFFAILKDSPCVDLLEAAESKTLEAGSFERDADVQPGFCQVTLTTGRKPKLRIYAVVMSDEIRTDGAVLSLRARGFEEFSSLGIGDAGVFARAPEQPSIREMELEELPIWMVTGPAPKPPMHVAVFQKDQVVVTVEMDARTFAPEEADALVESMKPALGELKRLGSR